MNVTTRSGCFRQTFINVLEYTNAQKSYTVFFRIMFLSSVKICQKLTNKDLNKIHENTSGRPQYNTAGTNTFEDFP